ncbi:class I SAM-dependent methyltransferase [Streptomonospora litoralis]|uniref:Ribosomal RNA small subunit methyltransferase C n=1 Tax=Streptomonospora litoralis TaxID=2498135 RepID=A0A4P6Q150_9ACTN|nr:methyltransferase [Streptomonospora litoralis]QBI54245.1 Ribosomal RNA small subunit methyltransferase C [Streptomonospora litoralis]
MDWRDRYEQDDGTGGPGGGHGHGRPQHYFAADPAAASRPASVELVLPDVHLRLATDRGVFSADRVDLGTRVLLESVPAPPPDGRLLDLGCGYGPIALAMAARAPRAAVLGVDVNARALELARRNAAKNYLYNVDFQLADPDGSPAAPAAQPPAGPALTGPFDALWSNPPIRIGKPALHALLRTWLARLAPGGQAHLVVQRNLGADSLHRWLEQEAGLAAERASSRAGYRILRVQTPA